MIYILPFVLSLYISNDTSIEATNIATPKSYTKQVLLNGLIGIGFGVSTDIFYTMGENAHDRYKESDSIRTTLDNWDKTRLYDNLRNVCAVGALFFTVRAVYYQLKHVKAARSAKYTPKLDLQYSYQNKWSLGVKSIF